MNRLTAPFFDAFNKTGGHTTRRLQQIDPENFFEEPGVGELMNPAGATTAMHSARPTTDGQVSMIGVYRHSGRPLFDEREARIAHILLSEIPSLHEAISPLVLNDSVSGLSPRLRQVLNLLIQGYSRKEIASNLALSIHAVRSRTLSRTDRRNLPLASCSISSGFQ